MTAVDIEESVISRALEVIRQRTGIVTPPHRRYLVRSALRPPGSKESLEEGLKRLLEDESRWTAMVSALTIGETYLFRHYGHYETLRELASKRKQSGRPCRVLCAGCATGEEAWSSAAILADVYGADAPSKTRVIGWDLDRERIGRARRGRYRSWSVRHGLKGYDDYFTDLDGTVVVNEALRSLTSFETVNLAAPPLPKRGPFDVIFFRNVAIYWTVERIETALAEMTRHLLKDGLLFVGPADPVNLGAHWQKSVEHDAIVFSFKQITESQPKAPSRPTDRSARPTARRQSSTQSRPSIEITDRLKPTSKPGSKGRTFSSKIPAARRSSAWLSRNRSESKTSSTAKSEKKTISGSSTGFESRPEPQTSRKIGPAGDDPIERVRALADRGKYREALTLLDTQPGPLPVTVRLLKGVIYLNLKQAGKAVDLFRQCVFLEPEERAHRQWLAVAYEALGWHREAQRELRNLAALSDGDESSTDKKKAEVVT